MTTLHIAHLYPKELGINGDAGNVMCLAFRARAFGLDVRVSEVGRDQPLAANIDLVHVGSGPSDSLALVLPHIRRHRSQLADLRDSGVPFLGISAGWFALSEQVRFVDGRVEDGAAVFPTHVSLGSQRAVGEVELQTSFGIVTGFENHSSHVSDAGLAHFGQMVHGVGSDPTCDKGERWDGVLLGASIGTNVHGPLLPMNPDIADALIVAAVTRRTLGWTLPNADGLRDVDDFARLSRHAVQNRL